MGSYGAYLGTQLDQCRERNKELEAQVEQWKDAACQITAAKERFVAERDALQAQWDAEVAGTLALRAELGARDDETYPDFVRRLHRAAQPKTQCAACAAHDTSLVEGLCLDCLKRLKPDLATLVLGIMREEQQSFAVLTARLARTQEWLDRFQGEAAAETVECLRLKGCIEQHEAREQQVRALCAEVEKQNLDCPCDPEVASVLGFAYDVCAILDGGE